MAIRKIITGAVLGAATVLATPMLATASESSLDEQVSSAIEARLNAAGGDTSSVSNVDIAVTPELIASAGGSAPDVLANYVVNEILAASEGPQQQVTPESTLSPMVEGSLNYTADEQVFIAAAGFAWINQDMKIATQNGSFAGAELVGSSYMTGIAFGQWNPNWSERYYNLALTCVSTTMNGTYSAVVKGSPINFAADVKAYDMWQNGGMVSSTAADCGMS